MNIVLKKPARQVETTEELSPLAALIEEVGALAKAAEKSKKLIKAEQEKLKPYEAKMKALVAAMDEIAAPDMTGVEKSEHFVAEFGKRSNTRAVKDMAKLRELMGDKLFMECVQVKLADVDAYLTQPQREEVLEKGLGHRTVTIKPRMA